MSVSTFRKMQVTPVTVAHVQCDHEERITAIEEVLQIETRGTFWERRLRAAIEYRSPKAHVAFCRKMARGVR